MAERKKAEEKAPLSQRLRRAALFVLFSLVLLIPKTLGLRRRPRLWNALRLLAALVGAVLVATLAGAKPGWVGPLAGLVLILLALLARPAREGKSVDERGRELGALVVLNGGRVRGLDGKATQARLYVAPERLHVLDLKHQPLLEIPLQAVSSVRVEEAEETKESKEGWRLVVEWREGSATFAFDGFFAEHLARVAETTLRSQLRQELPVIK